MPFDYRSEYQRYQQYYSNLRRFYAKPVARVSIFVVISFMTVSFFSLFAIKPTLVTISQLIREIEDKREINSQLEKKLVDLQRAQAEYASIRDIVPLAFQAMPTEPAVASLLMEVEVAAVKSQVIIINLQMQPVTLLGGGVSQKEAPEKVSFTVTAGGSLGQLESFLAAVTKLQRVIVVREANFSEGTPFLKKEGVAVTVGIEAEAYFIPEGGKKNRAG